MSQHLPLVARGRRHPDRRNLRTLAAVAITSMSLVLAACGSDSDEGSSSDNPSSSNASGVEEAKIAAQEATIVPTKIAVTEPITAPIPTGKRIAYISCGVPACNTQAEIATEAAAELGWQVTTIQATSAPADVQNAMQQAIRENYDGVMYAGFTKESFRRELSQLSSKGVPVVAVSTEDPVGDGITAVVRPAEEGTGAGALGAQYIIAQSDGKANVGLINLPAFKTIEILTEGFKSTLESQCPDCTYTQEDLPNTVFSKGDGPARIVAFLRANPKIDWLFLSNDALAVGLPSALKSAGLADKVKIGGAIGGTTNLAMIKEGQQSYSVPTPLVDIVWQQTDAMARHFAGQPVEASMKPTPRVVWTEETIPADISSFPAIVPTVREQYTALWGK
ncbi:sugar ABC transporter substrate-binding protein [Gordonia rubripertincta]|uniref:Substrate-binding domain-containing protein n=1 Tax=Gordonia rubripertincta TaxID=36822 RepID=A0ABT4MWQ0_GORRU|nr:substrate-binding domain-containing protein [Gordonia rubripertincta]MCZ4551445.1 substrate-binding domain-containing protein [Gordonia rubripertincta]